jgi:NhaP-type Na+/H+ or K+/H+ antiporter
VARSPFAVGLDLDSEGVREFIEITLAVVLFSDASSIATQWFRTEWRYPARLLGIGLPLTIVLGTVVATWVFPGVDVWLLAVGAAALAPTDAALGVSIIEDERIPLGFRQVINVESGLNDGLATPVVSFCIAMAAATVAGGHDRPVGAAVVELVLGIALGAGIGAASGRLVRAARSRAWAKPDLLPLAPLVTAIGTYVFVVDVGGNGFVAAFVCGVAFGGAVRHHAHDGLLGFASGTGQLLGYAVWFVFGGAVLAAYTDVITWRTVLYAVLSLTVLRMLPVAIASLGSGRSWDTVALTGWLGPRGLASIVFGILAADTIGRVQGQLVLAVIAVAVALSVLAHGLSAGPLATWYARRHPVTEDAVDTETGAG